MAEGDAGSTGGRVSILLLSKTGGGKSSLANALLKTSEFQVGRGMLSKTMYCKCISTHARGRDLTVVDTPGTMDVSDKARAEAEIKRAIGFCPDGFDIFLVVIKCDTRFTDEERLALDAAAKLFGEKFYTHAIVVFSHGDDYDNDEEEFKRDLERIRQEIPYLDELLGKCGNRFVLVDNGRRCDTAVQDRQIGALLSLTDSLMRSNCDRKFTSENFESEQKRQREAEQKMAEEAAEETRNQQEGMMQVMRREVEQDARRSCDEERVRRSAEMNQAMMLNVANGFMQLASMMTSALVSSSMESSQHRSFRQNPFEPDHRIGFIIGVRRRPGMGGFGAVLDSDSDSD